MRALGIFLIIVGLVWAVVAFNMDTTVTTESRSETYGSGEYAVDIDIPSVTVQNLGLMEARRNHLMFAGLTLLIGVVLVGFGSISRQKDAPDLRPCSVCAEPIQPAALKCRFCGADLPDSFRAVHVSPGIPMDASDQDLMQHYGITFNNKYYAFGEYHYDKLHQAVEHARASELQRPRSKA
jgi:hypothetical protein